MRAARTSIFSVYTLGAADVFQESQVDAIMVSDVANRHYHTPPTKTGDSKVQFVYETFVHINR